VEFVFSNGFAPTIGESFDFFSGASSINTTGTSFSYSGLEAGFLFDVAPDVSGNLRFQALNTGVPSATPEPGVLVLVAGGLLGIGLATRKRSQ
jgi:hypothetical protein